MKYTDVKEMSVVELRKKRSSLKGELFEARMKNQLGQLGNPLEIRHIRKDLARLNTALVQKVVR